MSERSLGVALSFNDTAFCAAMYAYGDSCALQREGERQSSDACADDRNFHCFGLSSGGRA